MADEAKFCNACGTPFENTQSQSSGTQDFTSNFSRHFTDHTAEFDPQDIAANKVYGILACFGILFFIPLVAAPQSKFARFYANQGLILFILSFVLGICGNIIYAIFAFLGAFGSIFGLFWLIGSLVSGLIWLVPLALAIIMLINVVNGKAVELPFVGKYTLIR